MYYQNVLETVGETPLIELKSFSPRPGVQIFAKMEGVNPSGSIKDRIAKKMIEQAEARGLLKAGSILLEPTSGNTGVAMALVAGMKGYQFTAVVRKRHAGETQNARTLRSHRHHLTWSSRQQRRDQTRSGDCSAGETLCNAFPVWQRGQPRRPLRNNRRRDCARYA